MGWGKVVLVFQAIITLVIGSVFLMQVIKVEDSGIEDLKIELINGETNFSETKAITNLKNRYKKAAYILGIVSIIELIIVGRLLR